MIFENENTTEGMLKSLKIMHANIPSWTSKENFTEIGHVGDQLTVERAVNCLLSVNNGFTADERLDGIHLEIAD